MAQGFAKRDAAESKADLISFFESRIKHHLSEKEVRYDLIDAVLTGEIGVVSSLVNRALVLEKAKGEESFKETVEALSRVMNIAVKLENEPKVSVELFENDSEKALYNEYVAIKEQYELTSDEGKQFALLASLQGAIEKFFEDTMVMADDESLRFNRLSVMKEVADLIKSFAFMNKVLVL